MSHYQNILPKQSTSPVSSHKTSTASFLRTLTSSSGSTDLDSSTLSTPKRVSTACSACKTRKSKCDGRQPCERCTRHNTECVIDEDEDLRRRRAVKRKLLQLESDRQLLVQLVTTLRDTDNESLSPLLNLIRADASLEEIRRYLATTYLRASESSEEESSPDKMDEEEDHVGTASVDDEESQAPAPPPPRSRALGIGDLLNSPA